jgi:oligo-1,6-glucosidase
VIGHLDHLERLGIDVVWLSPVYRSPMDDNGYDISDYRDVDPAFGSLGDLDELTDGLHERGMKLMMDLVVNHTSDEHPWFVASRSSREDPKRDWYWWRDPRPGYRGGEPGGEPTNWESHFSGPAWAWDEATGQYYLHVFSRKQPDLNWENPEVRREIYAMMRWWLDRGVDGFQFEHVQLDFGAHRYDPRQLDLPVLKATMAGWQAGLADRGWNSLYWGNHDQPRSLSRFGDDGEHRVASAKTIATVLHLHRGTPYVYQGDELGMANTHFATIADFRDIQALNFHAEATARDGADLEGLVATMARMSRDQGRTPVKWDSSPQAGFTAGAPWIGVNPDHITVNAAAQVDDPDSVFAHYRRLIDLRHDDPVGTDGDFELLLPEHPDIWALVRRSPVAELLVAANFAGRPVTFDLNLADDWGGATPVLANLPQPPAAPRGPAEPVTLRAWESVIWRRGPLHQRITPTSRRWLRSGRRDTDGLPVHRLAWAPRQLSDGK